MSLLIESVVSLSTALTVALVESVVLFTVTVVEEGNNFLINCCALSTNLSVVTVVTVPDVTCTLVLIFTQTASVAKL